MKDNMPHVFRALLLSILHSAIFLLTYFLAATLLILIVLLLSYIPIISNLALLILDFLEKRGDGISGFSAYISLVSAYYASEKLLLLITKHNPTRWLSLKLSGIWLIVYGIISLISNLLAGEDGAWLICLAFIGAGFVVYISSGKYEDAPTTSGSSSVSESTPAPDVHSEYVPHDEEVFLMEAADGTFVRVPESKLESWEAAQAEIKDNPRDLSDAEKRLVDQLVQRVYGPKEE